VDGAVGVDSLVAVARRGCAVAVGPRAAAAAARPAGRAAARRRNCDRPVRAGSRHAGDVQVLADVGFVFGLPATRSTWGRSATPHSPAPPARIERLRPRSSSPAGPN